MIKIENIIQYTPFGLKVKTGNVIRDLVFEPKQNLTTITLNNLLNGIGHKPILYPIASLTTPITHKGETFVPLLELAKIAFPELIWGNINYDLKVLEGKPLDFYFNDKTISFHAFSTHAPAHIPSQILLFRKCYEWKINLEGIEAVDPASLDVNPYE